MKVQGSDEDAYIRGPCTACRVGLRSSGTLEGADAAVSQKDRKDGVTI